MAASAAIGLVQRWIFQRQVGGLGGTRTPKLVNPASAVGCGEADSFNAGNSSVRWVG
ncbi:hypothetical protein [Paenibacillus roseipurpureus]|uniref:Uncharacterized protein n=1 Tax=Paenibacillus roseopurpureus TaxID=2918901 RepID=A0AA96LQM0_9BACL|nr:hypothetical protein [Paenibacillus sp. MBLB1832]WNR46215.1 hypothetical protein MJB10_09020 [Paenibacillus sp. MBLB1832]